MCNDEFIKTANNVIVNLIRWDNTNLLDLGYIFRSSYYIYVINE